MPTCLAASVSGVAHFACDSEMECLESIRTLLRYLPQNNREDPPHVHDSDDPHDRADEELLHIVRHDRAWNEEAARKQLLTIFEAAGPMSDVAKQGRRKLSSILFS